MTTAVVVETGPSSHRDYRDGVIEALADELAAAHALVAALTEAADVYRTMSVETCVRLHAQSQELERLGRRYAQLIQEFRDFRTGTRPTAEAA